MCADATTGSYSISFTVTDGVASGSANVNQLGQTTVSGTIQPNGAASLTITTSNRGTWNLSGTLVDLCDISDPGSYTNNNGRVAVGTFTLNSTRPGC